MIIGRDTIEWRHIKEWLEAEIVRLQAELALPTCGIRESDHIRGEIMFARHMIVTVEPERAQIEGLTSPRGTSY